MAHVVFINPRTHWDIKNVTTRLPLAALYIGSVLKQQGYSMRLVDQRVDDSWALTLHEALKERPLWVGITAMTGRQIQWGVAASQIVREIDPTIPIIWGGVHPTILPDQTLDHVLVDGVVVGEGEITSLELTKRIEEHVEAHGTDTEVELDLHGVDGVVWKQGGKTIHNPPRGATEMDEWPELDYSLANVEDYVLAEVYGERSLQITTSRGCPMKCAYCYLGVVPDGRCYRAECAERTVAHIKRLIRDFNINSIHIIDDEFFTQFKRARKVCQMLLDEGIDVTLRANCRVDYLNRMSMDDLKLFRRAGFQHIYLGAESGSNRVLEFIEKGITTEEILKANQRLKEAGIEPKFSFMGGLPSETMDEVKETLHLMLRLVKENPKASCTPVQLYNPYPGTPLFDYCLQSGMAMPKSLEDWAEWALERVTYRWQNKRAEHFLEKVALFTFFVDGKTIAENAPIWYHRLGARIYGYIVRARIRLGIYAFMPEIRALRWEYHNSQRRKDRSRANRYEEPVAGPASQEPEASPGDTD
ncbi:MAG: B12-binding domain-containing radical SAM protein [bacterium]|nr:B12-binding domain-containing radical SAM protein [bacterium]